MDRLKAETPPKLLEAMRYSVMAGGKRLRPMLALAWAETLLQKASVPSWVEDAACAVEWIHTYSLIHDDLPAMDDDDLRRGRPTNHKVYGEAMAILAGDALLTDAFTTLIGTAPAEYPVRAALVAELSSAAGAQGMVGGQVWDIADDRSAELAYLKKLHRMKTGALIRASCVMGALGAQGSGEAVAAARTYGEAVGLAFQIADDILDVTSTAEAMGKPVGADAAAARFTFPAVLGLEASKSMARACAEQALAAAIPYEKTPGPLAALARYAVERTH